MPKGIGRPTNSFEKKMNKMMIDNARQSVTDIHGKTPPDPKRQKEAEKEARSKRVKYLNEEFSKRKDRADKEIKQTQVTPGEWKTESKKDK